MRLRTRKPFNAAAVVASALIALAGAAAPVAAQFVVGGGGPGAARSQPVTAAELETYSRLLGLDRDQTEAAQLLHEGMIAEFQARQQAHAEERRALVERAREGGDHGALVGSMPRLMQQMREDRRRLEAEFLADLRAVLRDDQAERWPAVERQRRRDRSLPAGVVSCESVNLFEIVSALELPADRRAEVDEALRQYELDLDRALVARDAASEQARALIMGGADQMIPVPRADRGPEIEEARESVTRARKTVQEVNARAARRIASLLPEDLAARFSDAVRDASFPQVYDRPFITDAFGAALNMDDLTPEQRAEVQTMRESFARELEAANRRWTEAIRRAEEQGDAPLALGGAAGAPAIRIAGAAGNTEVADARAAREELESRFMSRLTGALSDTQRDRLPKPPDRRRARSITLPDGREIAIGAGPGGPDGAFFFSDDGGEQEIAVVRIGGDALPDPLPEGARVVRVIRGAETDEQGNVVREFEFVEDSEEAEPTPD